MNMQKPYEVALELYGVAPLESPIVYYRGDRNVYPITVRLCAGGDAYEIPDGAEAYFSFRRPDGAVDKARAQIADAKNGELHYRVAGSELAVAGAVTVGVELQTGEERLTWQPFLLRVLRALDDNGAQPPPAYGEWTRDIAARLWWLEAGARGLDGGAPDTVYGAHQTIDGGMV